MFGCHIAVPGNGGDMCNTLPLRSPAGHLAGVGLILSCTLALVLSQRRDIDLRINDIVLHGAPPQAPASTGVEPGPMSSSALEIFLNTILLLKDI